MVSVKEKSGVVLLAFITPLLPGCLATYLVKSSYEHVKILNARQEIQSVMQENKVAPAKKQKLQLALDARQFAEKNLGLTPTDNYTTYVDLDRPYVTWVLRAAPAYELKPHTWWYPIVGSMPYRGFYSEQEAHDAAKEFPKEKYDTYVRGVSAYSTLGWFDDPILSSMLRYRDHDLVNVIIHETVHATIFIKGHANFNESLATFLGNKGTELYYLEREGPNSKTVKVIRDENHDDQLFSQFIGHELKQLQAWYENTPELTIKSEKENRIQQIKDRFKNELQPKLLSQKYDQFTSRPLNNANLLSYKTYFHDLSDFEKLAIEFDGDFKKLIAACKKLEGTGDPAKELKNWIE
ncbi:MAG: aminopeptidase [Pseudobdellovibrionaceae bacterium]|nr:aminopeptidase [Bdellovibrionales bacterium]USN47398.1 MAG: aminopeptidase [Pseudobdellovibrionaceae bacterium]